MTASERPLTKVFHAAMLVLSFAALTLFQPPARADMVSEKQLAPQADLEHMQREIRAFMDREEVRRTLLDYGVDRPELERRLGSLSDAQVRQLHRRLREEPGEGGFLEALLGIIDIFTVLEIARTE